jgi:phospholipase C
MRLAALLAALALLGCSSVETETNPGPKPKPKPEPVLPGPAEWNREVTPPPDGEAATKRASCGYAVGALPAETQGESHPSGADIPVDHIVVLMMENRSFDHSFHETQLCFVDTNHEWHGTHQQIGGGAMNGFVVSNEGWHEVPVNGTLDMISGNRAMGYYDQSDLPFYYWLASTFAIADHYHSSIPGPTFPNRMYLYAASSFGLTHNTVLAEKTTIFDHLEKREVDWKVYTTATAGFAMFIDKLIAYQADHLKSVDDFFADAAAGKLPAVAFVDPNIGIGGAAKNDEHPPAVAMIGQEFVAQVTDALTKSPNWSKSALFLTYDEHGGLYDHVVPPPACPPDELTPIGPNGPEEGAFDQLGIRVPMMVVSPWAKKHFVAHHTYDHTSIVRFIEARFVMPALTNRDANAEAPWEMFDFDSPPHADPPAIPIPTVDQAKVDACVQLFGE